MKSKNNLNLLPALAILATVAILVAIGGTFAFSHHQDYIQGQAETEEYRVSSKVPGRVYRFYVKEGDQVHAGDTLALLEAPDIDAKLAQAEAAQSAAMAQNRKAERGARQEQIRAAYEMWQKAKAGLEITQKSYERIKRLHDEGVMTAQKLDEITAQRDAAIATEQAAKAQYDMAVNGADREDRAAAMALVEKARGAVREVNSYLSETVLIAPCAGEVSEIFPQEGELVGTGAPIMHIAKMQDMYVTFNVREDRLGALKMGQTIKATVPALGDKEISVRIDHIKDLGSYAAWKATKATGDYDRRTFEVKAVPVKAIPELRPGMSVLLK